jgi:hypothetical protein
MGLGRRDILLGRIGADHRCAEPRQRLRQDAGAAADIEDAQAVEAVEFLGVEVEMGRRLGADIGQAQRVELMQRRHWPARVPPGSGHAREPLDFGGVDAGSAGFGVHHGAVLERT